MSTRELGNSRERTFESKLWELGYRTARFSGSGQRVSIGRQENGIAEDLIGLAPEHSDLPHIIAEVGGVGKRLGASFITLREHPLPPGFVPVIARCVARRWRYYLLPTDRHETFAEFIAALRGVA